MEVGRVGDLKNSGWQRGAPPAGRRSAVSIGRTKTFSKKERLKANCASRWSAAGCANGTTKKGLDRGGLLMEVGHHRSGDREQSRQGPSTGSNGLERDFGL